MRRFQLFFALIWVSSFDHVLGSENASFEGLIIRPNRFTAVWRNEETIVNGYTVNWMVNGTEAGHNQLNATATKDTLIQKDQCVNLRVDVIPNYKKEPVHIRRPITFDGTKGLPIEPILSYRGSQLNVDWSGIWICQLVKSYEVKLTGVSGDTIYETTTKDTNLELASWNTCEPAELCIVALAENGEVLGHRCVVGVMPLHRGKPTKPEVKHMDHRLTITWEQENKCEPKLFSVLIKSPDQSQIVATVQGHMHRIEVSYPDWCSVCLVYVIASYEKFHDEVSEPTTLLVDHRSTANQKPGPISKQYSEKCISESVPIFAVKEVPIQRTKDRKLHASWAGATHCPIVMFHFHFEHVNATTRDIDIYMKHNSCVIVHLESEFWMTVYALTAHNQMIKSSKVNILAAIKRTLKLCISSNTECYVSRTFSWYAEYSTLQHYNQ